MSIKADTKTILVIIIGTVIAGLILSFLAEIIPWGLEHSPPIIENTKPDEIGSNQSQYDATENAIVQKPDIIIIPKIENQTIDRSTNFHFNNNTIGDLNINLNNSTHGDGCLYNFVKHGPRESNRDNIFKDFDSGITIILLSSSKFEKNLDLTLAQMEGCQNWYNTMTIRILNSEGIVSPTLVKKFIISENGRMVPLNDSNHMGFAKISLPVDDKPRYLLFSYDERELVWWDIGFND